MKVQGSGVSVKREALSVKTRDGRAEHTLGWGLEVTLVPRPYENAHPPRTPLGL